MRIIAPPAPSLGNHTGVIYAGQYLGASVETHTGRHTPVCARCRRPLDARRVHRAAVTALIQHWHDKHWNTTPPSPRRAA